MAKEVTIGGDGTLFVGEDKVLNFEILDVDLVPVNLAGKIMTFVVAKTDKGAALLTKTPSVVGTYNSTRASNTQRARVALTDDDLAATVFTQVANPYRYALKTLTAGDETVFNYGDFAPQKAPAP